MSTGVFLGSFRLKVVSISWAYVITELLTQMVTATNYHLLYNNNIRNTNSDV